MGKYRKRSSRFQGRRGNLMPECNSDQPSDELNALLGPRQAALVQQRSERIFSKNGVNYEVALKEVPLHVLPEKDPQRVEIFNFGIDPVTFKLAESSQERMRMLIAYQCVYKENGYLPRDYDVTKTDEWYGLSIPLIGVTERGKVVAATRFIRPDTNNLFPIHYVPKFGDICIDEEENVYGYCLPKSPEDINKTVEISALALVPEALDRENHSIMKGTIKAMFNYFEDNGINFVYASLDKRVYDLLISCGIPFEKVGKEAFYMGSITVPVFMDLRKMLDIMKKNALGTDGNIVNKELLEFHDFIKLRRGEGYPGIFSFYKSKLEGDN